MNLTTPQRELVRWLRDGRLEEPAAYEVDGETYEDGSGLLVSEARLSEECSRVGLDYRETLDILTGYGILKPVPCQAHGGSEGLYYIADRATVAVQESEATPQGESANAATKATPPVTPPVDLTQSQAEILDAIRIAGGRLTTSQVMKALPIDTSPGTTKNTLATLVQFRVLVNHKRAPDEKGIGYGLPEWEQS